MIDSENQIISVIVPIYKVEEYMDECIASIVNQTYKNLEIILVDDGSPDNCPRKCDEWAGSDGRIKVVHKKNGGLSSARNAGLDAATGDFIGFVDSDDYIAPTMYSNLLNQILRCGDDCVIANGRILSDKEGDITPYKKEWNIESDRFVSYNDFALQTILTRIGFTVWSKLYRAEILQHVRFKEGRNNEDTMFMFELSKVLEEKKKGMIDVAEDVYYYRQRNDSICSTAKVPLEIDVVKNFTEIIEYYSANKDIRMHEIIAKRSSVLTQLIAKLMSRKEWEDKYFDEWYAEFKKIKVSDIPINKVRGKIFKDYLIMRYLLPIAKYHLHKKHKI